MFKRFGRTFVLLLLSIFLSNTVFSYTVAESVVSDVEEIEFENYQGDWSKRETVAEVMSIGEQLADAVEYDNDWGKYINKYSIIHATSDEEPELLAADIFSIDEGAMVNHIYNVWLIISGYLESEYNYSTSDAWLLAKLITYYNAHYRGNTDYFAGAYKTVVNDHLTANNAGISTKYYEWPGQTRLVIPLTRYSDGTSTQLDTTSIVDEDVEDSMRLEEDMSLDERRDLIEMEERQVDELETRVEQSEEELETEREKEEQLREEIEDDEEEVTELQEQLEETDDEEEQQQLEEEIEEREQEKAEKEQELEDTEENISELEEDIETTEQDIAEREEIIEERTEKLEEDERDYEIMQDPAQALQEVRERESELEDREEEVAERETEIEEQEDELDEREDRLRDEQLDENVYGDNLYYLKINNYYEGGYYNNNMYIIDPISREISVKSPYDDISGSEFDIFSEGVIVIGYEGDSYANHRLIKLDPDTLELVDKSTDTIFHRSFVEINNDYIYAISSMGGDYYLSKYDDKLNRVARSTETVASDTFISFFGDYVYVNSSDKEIMVLNVEDLSYEDTISP